MGDPGSGRRFGKNALTLLQTATIVAAAFWIFFPAVHGGWLWDDPREIAENPVLRDPAGLAKIWFAPAGADYFPLKTTVQWLAWQIGGGGLEGFHVLSLALHALSGLLLWRLLRKLGVRLAWAGGLLFVVHPLTVASVAWLSELKNTLSLPLLLCAALAYLDYDEPAAAPRAPGDYALSLFFFLAAMLSKTSVVMFPCVILLYAWWRRGKVSRRDLIASAPYFAVSLALGLVTVFFQRERAMLGMDLGLEGPVARAAAAGLGLAHYLWRSLWPFALEPIYPRWRVDPPLLVQFTPWLGLAAALFFLRRNRGVLLGLGFFLLNLLPVLGFVPMAYLRISWVADHLAYLPLAGLVGLIAAGFSAPWRRASGFRLPLLGLLIVSFALASRHYAAIFRGNESFWNYAERREPGLWRPREGYGQALAAAGKVPEAIRELTEAVRLAPERAETHHNLGILLASVPGRSGEAIAELDEAVRLKPKVSGTRVHLAGALLQANRIPEAIIQLREAVRLDPSNASLRRDLDELSAGAPQ